MFETSFLNKTPSAEIKIHVKVITTTSNRLIQYEDKDSFNNLCMLGCPNYANKWSCPPFSPTYSDYCKEYPFATLVLFSCKLDQFYYTKMDYMKIKASNSILKSRMDKFMRNIEQIYGGIIISNGSCRLCNPCNKKIGSGCKKPTKMRFSMESTGLNVDQITKDIFDHKLLWYKDKKAPDYSTVVSCLLTKERIEDNKLAHLVSISLL